MRDWQIATQLGLDPLTADEVPAQRIDWMLAVDQVHRQVQADKERAANG